jgi:hypothetical protein
MKKTSHEFLLEEYFVKLFLKQSRQMTKFISDKQEHQKKKKQEGKKNLICYVWNKHWKSMSASSPRISRSQQGLVLVVYLIYFFYGFTTWKGSRKKQPMQVQRIFSS